MIISVRRVPWGWIHPTDGCGKHIPLIDTPFELAEFEWLRDKIYWETQHLMRRQLQYGLTHLAWKPIPKKYEGMQYEDVFQKPREGDYRPNWSYQFCPCCQFYDEEKLIPISPVFETASHAAKWAKRNISFEDLQQFRMPDFITRVWLVKSIEYQRTMRKMYYLHSYNDYVSTN